MASKGLDASQIVALVGGGKSVSPKNWRQTLLALVKNPEMISSLQNYGIQQDQSLQRFDPNMTYDPLAINSVKQRYDMMGDKYRPLVNDFFNTLAATGGGPDFEKFKNDFSSDGGKTAAEKYGLDAGEVNTLIAQMEKDQKPFLSAQTQVQQANMAEFYKKRKATGATGTMGSVAEPYLKKATGISGLTSLTSDPTVFIKQKMAEKFGSAGAESLFAKLNVTQKVKKSKFNPLAAGLAEVIKKTATGA